MEFIPSNILSQSSEHRRKYERDNNNQRAAALVLNAMALMNERAGKLTAHSLGYT